MSEEKIYVVAVLQAKEGQAGALGEVLRQVVPKVRQENGCLRYDLHHDKDRAGAFMFYEAWSDDEALAAHGTAPHMLEMRERIKDLVAAPLQLTFWRAQDVTPDSTKE